MKIVLLGTGYTPVTSSSRRSVETSIFLLAKSLADLRHEVTVVDVPYEEPRGASGASFREVYSPRWLDGSNPVSYLVKILIFTIQLLAVLRSYRDVDIIQSYAQFPTAAAFLAKKLLGCRATLLHVACSPYLAIPSSLSRWLMHTIIEKWSLRRADRVIAHTTSMGWGLLLRFGLDKHHIALIPAGVDTSLVRRREPQSSSKVVLYPAAILPRKNQMAIVQAAPEILRACPDCRFIFVGPLEDTRYCEHLRAAARELGIADKIELRGPVSHQDVFKLYSAARLMMFPTLFEMQGIVLVEAMAAGLPIVASDIEVIRDVVDARPGCALLTDPRNAHELAKAAVSILTDKRLSNRLSRKGKALARSRFSWDSIAQEFEKEYVRATKHKE